MRLFTLLLFVLSSFMLSAQNPSEAHAEALFANTTKDTLTYETAPALDMRVLRLIRNGTFHYEAMGCYYHYTTEGTWRQEGNEIVLNTYGYMIDTLDVVDWQAHHRPDQEGFSINITQVFGRRKADVPFEGLGCKLIAGGFVIDSCVTDAEGNCHLNTIETSADAEGNRSAYQTKPRYYVWAANMDVTGYFDPDKNNVIEMDVISGTGFYFEESRWQLTETGIKALPSEDEPYPAEYKTVE